MQSRFSKALYFLGGKEKQLVPSELQLIHESELNMWTPEDICYSMTKAIESTPPKPGML